MSLDRFVTAQEDVWPRPLTEVQAGRKTSHWMWFIFPQLASLGRSETAKFYGIADLPEAAAYLAHPVLRPRLEQVAQAMLGHKGKTAESVLGPVDALKLRSSMTLFDAVPGSAPVFGGVIDTFFDSERCPLTLAALMRR